MSEIEKRLTFYSFHYRPDVWRASQVRNIGHVEGNRPAPDNDWEEVLRGGEEAIKHWISEQLKGRSCTIVLVGSETAGRKWISHEISESWNKGMGVVGIRIHGLKDVNGYTSLRGGNPFDHVTLKSTGIPLSSIVKCYDPAGADSKARYAWIADNLLAMVEEAITIRKKA